MSERGMTLSSSEPGSYSDVVELYLLIRYI